MPPACGLHTLNSTIYDHDLPPAARCTWQRGTRELTIDLDRLENLSFSGDGPAYKAMDAMVSVREREGYEGFKGAPRIECALVELLANPRGNQTGRPER